MGLKFLINLKKKLLCIEVISILKKCKIQTKKLREIDSRTFIAYFVINITMFIDKRIY